MDEQELKSLKSHLYQRRAEAFSVEQVSLPEGEPVRQHVICHDRVDAYVESHPACKPARGWLIGDHCFFLYFNAHSVVEKEDGSLIDITPTAPPCPFLRHPDGNEEFSAIISEKPRLTYELPPEEWPDLSELVEFQKKPPEEDEGF